MFVEHFHIDMMMKQFESSADPLPVKQSHKTHMHVFVLTED